jgi:type IV secretory pathway VirB2 component (pilin)
VALAANCPSYIPKEYCISQAGDTTPVMDWVSKQVIPWILMGVGILAVIMIIVSAIRITTSGGNPEKVKSGKNTLLWSVIGLAIALLATVIVNLVISVANTADNAQTDPPEKYNGNSTLCKNNGYKWDGTTNKCSR